MSTRAFRRLHGVQDFPDIPKLDDPEKSEEEDSDPDTLAEHKTPRDETFPLPVKSQKEKKKMKKTNAMVQINPFDLLTEDLEEIEDKETEETMEVGIENGDNISQDNLLQKKKKRKKKKKKKAEINIQQSGSKDDEDEIESSIREVNEILGEIPARLTIATPDSSLCHNLLRIEHKHLNPDNEMRKMFGSRVVQNQTNTSRNRRHRNRRRTTWLVQAKNTWPPLTKTGLTMEIAENNSKGQHFVFVHNKDYQKIQFQFLDAVESIDPQNLINMAQLYPHHVDTLLQVSEICKMSDDMQMATEFIERALYIYECAFHPLFNLTQNNIRLDYRKQENRAFYIALFRHLNFIGKRGCYRTSLEFCKLLLSLDPDGDPLCVLLMIDFFALRSDENGFLIRLYEEWEAHRNLSQLPNFALSVPLAMFHVATQANEDTTAADLMLQSGLILFPGVLLLLLDKCSVAPDGQVSKHSFFVNAQFGQAKALQQLLGLYVGRTFSCWKEPEVITWLERNVAAVLRRVDDKDPFVDECALKRNTRYQGTPRNIHRHIMIAEVKEATAALPPDLAHVAVMSYDPLPPPDTVSAYTRPPRPNRVAGDTSGALSLFFQSLLPNYNPQEVPEPGAAGGEAHNFREGVAQVMDAMRDMLNNIRPVAPPVENEGNDNEMEEGDEHDWD